MQISGMGHLRRYDVSLLKGDDNESCFFTSKEPKGTLNLGFKTTKEIKGRGDGRPEAELESSVDAVFEKAFEDVKGRNKMGEVMVAKCSKDS